VVEFALIACPEWFECAPEWVKNERNYARLAMWRCTQNKTFLEELKDDEEFFKWVGKSNSDADDFWQWLFEKHPYFMLTPKVVELAIEKCPKAIDYLELITNSRVNEENVLIDRNIVDLLLHKWPQEQHSSEFWVTLFAANKDLLLDPKVAKLAIEKCQKAIDYLNIITKLRANEEEEVLIDGTIVDLLLHKWPDVQHPLEFWVTLFAANKDLILDPMVRDAWPDVHHRLSLEFWEMLFVANKDILLDAKITSFAITTCPEVGPLYGLCTPPEGNRTKMLTGGTLYLPEPMPPVTVDLDELSALFFG